MTMCKKIILTTYDGVSIVGDFYESDKKNSKSILLLHMMPATRDSFTKFANKLKNEGFSAFAIDLRGHGDSIRQVIGGREKNLNFKNFSDKEHQQSINDVRKAIEFLKKISTEIFLIGASIGANLALWSLNYDKQLKGALLLSPGLNYRGVKTLSLAQNLNKGQKIFFVASRDDICGPGESADTTARFLYNAVPRNIKKEIKIFDKAGHGTTIFEREPEFMDNVILWLKNR